MLEAQEEQFVDFSLFSLGLKVRSEHFDLDVEPHTTLSTHIQDVGAQTRFTIYMPRVPVLELLYIHGQISYSAAVNDLGIPGERHTLFLSGALGFSWGALGTLPNYRIPLGRRRHNIIYQYGYYLDSINTSSATGSLSYYYSRRDFIIGLIFENDALAFMGRDEYRTFGTEISSLFRLDDEQTIGAGIGLTIWTGSALDGTIINDDRSLTHNRRGVIFDISDTYGGAYSHGILFVSFYYNSFRVSIGWDSETIRDIFQNGFHYVINVPNIVTSAKNDRFFIRLDWNPRFSVY